MHKLQDVSLTRENFDKGNFDIKEFANKSFGIYQNKIIDVKLQFKPEVADDVLNYNFHPTQKVKQNSDGTVKVEFKASGELEIIWHLFKWGDNVKIIFPKILKDKYVEQLEKCLSCNK